MKKTAIVFTLFLLVIIGAYLSYDKFYQVSNRGIWEYVTNDAAFVFELNDNTNLLERITKSGFQKSLDRLSEFIEIQKWLKSKDSTNSSAILSGPLLVSAHVTSNSTLGYTFFIDLNISERQSAFLNLLGSKSAGINTRIYQGREIKDIEIELGHLSYFVDNNILVCSLNPFLVEDVIRLLNGDNVNSFLSENTQVYKAPKLTNDDGNVYVNFNNLNKLAQIFKIRRESSIEDWASNCFLDVSLSDNGLFFNGFTFTDQNEYLDTFIDQTPINDQFNNFIPTSASEVTKWLTSDAKLWYNRLLNYWNIHETKYLLKRNDFIKTYNYDINETYSWIKEGLCSVVFDDGPNDQKLLLVSTNDINQALNQLNVFAEKTSQALGDSLYTEQYGDYVIKEIKVEDFPMKVFGPDFKGYESTYYMALGRNIAFGNSIEIIKNLLFSIENEETWGKSVAYNTFFESGLAETNVSVAYNLQRMWPRTNSLFKPEWRDYFNNNSQAFKSFKLASIQFSRVDDNFYTNISLLHDQKAAVIKKQFYQVNQSLSFTNPIITKPYVVKNHNTNRLEVIVQDSLSNLSLISSEGKKLWSTLIGDVVTSEIVQLDYYNNKKLQYFFSTGNSLFIIDRLGNKVENFPVELDYKIQFASVVDYDNSKKYRFLLADDRGNIHLLNKEGKALDGWNPMKMTGKLASKPFHLRVRGRDCIVALQQDGKLVAWNRRGELMKGFPLLLEDRFDTDIFVDMGSDFSKTYLHILSRAGRLYKVNLEGQIQSSEELYKQTKEARFQIIPDALNKSYLIARQETNRLVLVSDKKSEILAKDYLGSDKLKVQYYYFTPDNQVYVVTDPVQEFTYIYRSDGTLVNSTPIESDKEIGVLYSESKNQYTVYTIINDTYNILTF